MKQHSMSVSKAIKDIERISQEVKNLETDLEATGSARTTDDVQNQLQDVSNSMCVVPSRLSGIVFCVLILGRSRSNERERQALQTEKERASNALRTHEKDLNDMQLREVNLKSQLKDREILERQVEEMKAEVAAVSQNSKARILLFFTHSPFFLTLLPSGHRFENRGCPGSN